MVRSFMARSRLGVPGEKVVVAVVCVSSYSKETFLKVRIRICSWPDGSQGHHRED
jgi:hypothetical protein